MEGHKKINGEGVLKAKILKAKLEYPRGTRGAKQKTFHSWSIDINGTAEYK